MIAVIADDFTGAAELAGISLRYGLTVDLYLDTVVATNADVLIICTDSRSFNVEDAREATTAAIENILQLKPTFIYKKIDSVLRGHVLEEITVQMKLYGYEKVLIIPSNPSLGRAIINGEYLIEGKKITDTGFAADPEFPIVSSAVKEMIGNDAVLLVKSTAGLPAIGIVIGEAASQEDIAQWANVAADEWMLAGAGDFYSAILDKSYRKASQAPVYMKSPHLYICGTAFNERKKYIKTLQEKQDCVAYMPAVMDNEWIGNTLAMVRHQKKGVIAINQVNGDAAGLRSAMAVVTREVILKENIKEIFIEGGATAAAVLKELRIQKLSPVNELQRGVVRMKASFPSLERMAEPDLFITVKPGSYELPAEIKALYM